ncbi:hypothetical protein B0H66DRAFT_552842 [Apodospora peruviana]|uniref:Uncharacterized protein n=1 Tax=Apodospora peruviana TaxID=516989 RepID=A0AAE0M776_9PEZI|nr:hypothetical protein B0H66DRAFT_552842 [Apodospora peruviana]
MKTTAMIPSATALTSVVLALFAGSSSAFWGQLRLDTVCSEGCNTILNLKDYNTGSTYTCGTVNPTFCTSEGLCRVFCTETSPGGFNFFVQYWHTNDGCNNLDFQGALDSHHGWCCGGTPCDIGA